MFSVLFPGQGSQSVGMAKDFYDNFEYVQDLFNEAEDTLNFSITKLIFDGPKDLLDQTENTQPAIFLVSYAIFQTIKKETSFDFTKVNFFAGHSLGEYSALACSNAINFKKTLQLLKTRGNAMQNAVPKNEGGMVAVLGENLQTIEEIINKNSFNCFIANDNSIGQVVISGKTNDINLFTNELKKKKIKNVKLAVSAPFHCILMKPATLIMDRELKETEFLTPENKIVSNVTAEPSDDPNVIKNLLIAQIEKTVRWRESVISMASLGSQKFIEIGPGKVLSGLVKRIDRKIELIQVNNIQDLDNLKNL